MAQSFGGQLFDGKDYFTIYDFVKAYEHFSDPEWDGEPVEPEPPKPRPVPKPRPGMSEDGGGWEEEPPRQKVKVKLADGKERLIQHMTATTFWSPDGKPMSAKEFIERLYGELPSLFQDEDQLRELWGKPDTRKALLESLAERGFGEEQLQEIGRLINAEKSDVYDVLAYIGYAAAPITREKRVATRRDRITAPYDKTLQAFLDFVLAQYVQEGVGELDDAKLPDLLELKYRSLHDAAAQLGGVARIRNAFVEFQAGLYRPD